MRKKSVCLHPVSSLSRETLLVEKMPRDGAEQEGPRHRLCHSCCKREYLFSYVSNARKSRLPPLGSRSW